MHSALLESPDTQVRYRVMTGEDDDRGRRGAKQIVGRSEVSLHCKDAATIEKTVEALRLSDAELVKRPEASRKYDWQSVFVEPDQGSADGGGNVLFGVAWYDEDYFTEKAEVYGDKMHSHMFGNLGITEKDVTVTHWRAAIAA
ncbi:hypothetical protein [Streptomyces sp. CB02115]|uniref:hypothetical protein n=1 Tax=Streptomyces sp. CB02115 TaxID=1703939 RepID=UPI00093C401B|nr:hypothetical protein [Streptomyces sp. CB02115]OKJ55935.1 hypothetical protein AMK28_13770 [Streptomyces sp. CB02115]